MRLEDVGSRSYRRSPLSPRPVIGATLGSLLPTPPTPGDGAPRRGRNPTHVGRAQRVSSGGGAAASRSLPLSSLGLSRPSPPAAHDSCAENNNSGCQGNGVRRTAHALKWRRGLWGNAVAECRSGLPSVRWWSACALGGGGKGCNGHAPAGTSLMESKWDLSKTGLSSSITS